MPKLMPKGLNAAEPWRTYGVRIWKGPANFPRG
jgi:hypothetical protein